MKIGLVLVGFIALAIVVRLLAGSSDRRRIEGEIASRGGTLLEVMWQPFGKGWFGEKNDRIYSVRYRDREGVEREAWCKTSMMSGVYFADDRVVAGSGVTAQSPEAARLRDSIEELRREHERLLAENDRLRNEIDGRES